MFFYNRTFAATLQSLRRHRLLGNLQGILGIRNAADKLGLILLLLGLRSNTRQKSQERLTKARSPLHSVQHQTSLCSTIPCSIQPHLYLRADNCFAKPPAMDCFLSGYNKDLQTCFLGSGILFFAAKKKATSYK